jgi:hypothetical protein
MRFVACIGLVGFVAAVPLEAQRISDARVAYARASLMPADASDTSTKPTHHPTGARIFMGTLVAIPSAWAGAYVGAAMHLCFTGDTADVCEFDFLYAAVAGYIVGSALGAGTFVEGPKCGTGSRFARGLLGSTLGSLASIAAIGAGGGRTVGAEAVAVTTIAVLGPPIGAAIALLPCD